MVFYPGDLAENENRRLHRKIVMQLLNPKAVKSFDHVLDYEAHMLIKALFEDSKCGKPINPAHYTGRMALKSVVHCLQYILADILDFSAMLNLTFGFRIGSTRDSLVERAIDLTMEFMDLTGKFYLLTN